MECEEYYSLAFFGAGYRDALSFCGTKSGRDFDKWKETGLTPAFDLAPYPEQANTVLICRKLYRQDMTPESFLDAEVRDKNYPGKDYHRVFVGEIVKLLIREVIACRGLRVLSQKQGREGNASNASLTALFYWFRMFYLFSFCCASSSASSLRIRLRVTGVISR